jgi:hypothetical protein
MTLMSEHNIDELGLTAQERQNIERLWNVRAWNMAQAEEHETYGRVDDARRCRNNVSQIDVQVRSLLKHADHRERCSEHHVGEE